VDTEGNPKGSKVTIRIRMRIRKGMGRGAAYYIM